MRRSAFARARKPALVAVGVMTAFAATNLSLSTNAAPAAFGYGTAAFVNSAVPSTLTSDFGPGGALLINDTNIAGEPSIGINWKTGAALYMADRSTYKITIDNATTPPAISWTDASSPYSLANLDPILATDSQTGTTIAGGDDGLCSAMSITHDDGASWTPTVPCPFAPDHPTIGTGPFHAPIPADAVGNEVSYFCQQPTINVLPDECSYTHDGGTTWQPSVVDTARSCFFQVGHVKISPDGTAYIPNKSCTDASSGKNLVGGLITTDNGQSLSSYRIPGAPTPAAGFDPTVATDTNNRVYESWSRAGDYHPVVTWSDDQAKTWAPQVDLAQTVSPALTAATFESAVSGDGGRAAVAYLGTWAGVSGQNPFTTGFHGVWYLFVSYTYDGGKTWQTVQATPEPVQRGEIDSGGTTTGGQRNLLDFMDASVTKDGRVVVAYADGCLNACNSSAGTEAQSQTDAYATIAYQSAGQGLFAGYDTAPPVTAPSSPALTATPDTSNGTVGLSWSAPNDGGAPITSYQVSRGLQAGTETPYQRVTTGTTFTDTAVTVGTTYYYTVSAVNDVGSSAASNEVSVTPTTTPAAATLAATPGKGQVILSWTTPATGGAPISGWEVYRGTASGTRTLIQTISTGTSYVDNSVTGGTTYYYVVAADNRNGRGAFSNEASVVPRKGK
ncbi:MAG: hypothetical protein QOF18_2466 [Frankiaceae bacterium]|nr:hypothetical protein [Frankiaceae bacterium]